MKKKVIYAVAFVVVILIIIIIYNAYWEYAKNKSLKEHFGNVSLSDEQIEDMAKDVVMGEQADEIDAFNSSAADFDKSSSEIYSTRDNIEQMVLSKTGTFSEQESKEYASNISNFISSLKEYITDRHTRSVDSIELLFDEGDPDKDSLINKLNESYQSQTTEIETSGGRLIDVVSASLQDNLITESEQADIKDLLDKITSIVDEYKQNETNNA